MGSVHVFTTLDLLALLAVAFLVGAAVATSACVLLGLHLRVGRKELIS